MSLFSDPVPDEGYVYCSYGSIEYLKHAVASLATLRRYDRSRQAALFCSQEHQDYLLHHGLRDLFSRVDILPVEKQSTVGFKHNLHEHMIFQRNLYIDSDIVWCKDPATLWRSFSAYPFTITGTQVSDAFFGGAKDYRIVFDVLLRRRKRTLRKFDLRHLSRVQTGMIYAEDYELTQTVCSVAKAMLARRNETHFRSRTHEHGRSEESCEWSLAMAMSKLDLQVYPWLQGSSSPQLDYVSALTLHDADFERVLCRYFCDETVYSFRGLRQAWLRDLLVGFYSQVLGRGDYLETTPFGLHFGWLHEKQPFYDFAERTWKRLTQTKQNGHPVRPALLASTLQSWQ